MEKRNVLNSLFICALAVFVGALVYVVPAHVQAFTLVSESSQNTYQSQMASSWYFTQTSPYYYPQQNYPPQTSSGCVVINSSIYFGSSDYFTGGEVSRLQNFLIARGYMQYGDSTGFFGITTLNAVRYFQSANGISPTGLVGPQTRARIQSMSCVVTPPVYPYPYPPTYPPQPPVYPPIYPWPPVTRPSISSLTPSSGPVGTIVTVYGSGFDSNTTINFGGAYGPNIQIINSNTLTFKVPTNNLPACAYGTYVCMIYGYPIAPGNYQVTVKNNYGTSNAVNFTVTGQTQTQSPVISYITPSSGGYNIDVTIVGSEFDRYNNSINYAGRSRVAINVPSYDGTTLRFRVPATPCSDGMMCAQVVLAPGTYPISVTNQNGTSNSVNYTLTGSGSSQPINQTVSVRINQVASIGDNFKIRPLRIVEDSRCPSGVYCIQAGRVVVETQLQSYDMLQNSNLSSTSGSEVPNSVTFDGYIVRITEIQPQARQGGLSTGEYVITYNVTKP